MVSKKFFIILGILILLGIFIRFYSLDKDFTCEETDFVKASIAISNTGHPLLDISEQAKNQTALWHPPMYIYSMGFLFKLFGQNEITARSLNIIFSLLITILIFLFCFNLLKKEKGLIIGIVASSLFLINYYVFSSSILIDIDIFSTFFVFGFIYFIFRNYQTRKISHLIFGGIFLFFGLWNRYPIMILTYFFIGIYLLFNKDFQKSRKNYLMMGFLAGLFFILIWGFYSIIIEPGNFLSFIYHNVRMGGEQFTSLTIYVASFILNISQFIRLVTFPCAILIILSTIYFLKNRTKFSNILLVYVLPTMIFFFLVPRPAFGYPRYFMSVFPGIFILISSFIYIHLKQTTFQKKEIYLAIFCFFVSIGLLIFFNVQGTFYESDGLIKATNLPDFLLNLFASMPLLLVIFFKNDKKKILLIILLALFLSYSFYFDYKLLFHKSYTKEVGDYLKEKTGKEDIIIVPKAIGYYSERKFYVNDFHKPKLDFSFDYLKEYYFKSIENREMNSEFFWPGGIYSGIYPPQPSENILKNVSYVVSYYSLEEIKEEIKIGKFYVYHV